MGKTRFPENCSRNLDLRRVDTSHLFHQYLAQEFLLEEIRTRLNADFAEAMVTRGGPTKAVLGDNEMTLNRNDRLEPTRSVALGTESSVLDKK